MERIVVLGAGVCGLAAALMLRRDGHEVAVLERDPAPVPDTDEDAWERWERGGVTQFRQAHLLQPLGRIVLDEELPDVRDALLAAGAARFDPLRLMPPWIADRRPRLGDERFATITARRPVIEHALARVAQEELDVRRGVEVERLVCNGIPRIAGVRTADGENLPADLVVDAMGRRSRLPAWLADAGVRGMHEESEEFGFLYYSRFFRGDQPRPLAPLLTAIGTISLLTLPSERDTWSVTVLGAAGDRPLKRMRNAEKWTAVVNACPLQAHWLEGEPITDILCMGGIVDRYRRLVPGTRPAAVRAALTPAAMCDPDVLRAMLAERCCLGSPTALNEPELAERVLELARDAEPAPPAGPDRKQLLTLLA